MGILNLISCDEKKQKPNLSTQRRRDAEKKQKQRKAKCRCSPDLLSASASLGERFILFKEINT
jgi:hypothetical protein